MAINPSLVNLGAYSAAAAFGISPFQLLPLPAAISVSSVATTTYAFSAGSNSTYSELTDFASPMHPFWRSETPSFAPTHAHASAASSSGYAATPAKQKQKIEASAVRDEAEDSTPATFDDFTSARDNLTVRKIFRSMIVSKDWETVSNAIQFAAKNYSWYFQAELTSSVFTHIREHGGSDIPAHICEECATLCDGLSPDDFTPLGVVICTGNLNDILQIFRSMIGSKDWAGVSYTIKHAREHWYAFWKNNLILAVAGHIKKQGESAVPTHIREECAALCDGLKPDDLKTDFFTILIREKVQKDIQSIVHSIQCRVRRPDIIYNGEGSEFWIDMHVYLALHKEYGVIPAHVIEAVPTDRSWLASDLVTFLQRIGMLEEAWPLMACVNQFCDSEIEKNEKAVFVCTLAEYIKEHGESAVPTQVLKARDALPYRVRGDIFKDLLSKGEWEKVSPFLSSGELGKTFTELLCTHFNALLLQGAGEGVERALTEANEHYSIAIKTLLANSLTDYIDAHGVRAMPLSILDAGTAFLSALSLQIFEDDLRNHRKGYDPLACATATLAYPDASIDFARALNSFVRDYKYLPRCILAAGNALLGDETSDLAKCYASEVSAQAYRNAEGYWGRQGYESKEEIRRQDDELVRQIVYRWEGVPVPIRLHKTADVMSARAAELRKLHQDIVKKERGPLTPLIDGYNASGDVSLLSYETVALAIGEGGHTAQDAELCKIMMREHELGPWRWDMVKRLLERDTTGSVAKMVFDQLGSENGGGAYRRRDSVPPEIFELARTVMERDVSRKKQVKEVPEQVEAASANDNGWGSRFWALIGRL